MKVLVTGGLGFQGCYLVKALIARGDDVTVLAQPSRRAKDQLDQLVADPWFGRVAPSVLNKELHVAWGSVTDRILVDTLINGGGFNAVVHMAALANPEDCRERPRDAYAVNVGGTQNVLDACANAESSPHLIHVSTCEVYGSASHAGRARFHCGSCECGPYGLDELEPQDEAAATDPPHIYGASKLAADALVRAYAHEFGILATILRPCNVYGPGQHMGLHGAVIPTMTRDALMFRVIVVRGGGQAREFIHIEDLARMYLRIIDAGGATQRTNGPDIFNIGTGDRVRIGDIAVHIHQLVPDSALVKRPARIAEPGAFCLDSSHINRQFGPVQTIPFLAGLERYVEWAKAQHTS